MAVTFPTIPEYITVHLGLPDQPAENVQVPFVEYIKNVASSEIYPTWPESALVANILAEISFALNRIYTEHYRSQGYDFDITNTTQFDQYFVPGRDIFENISRIVDDVFNSYVVKGEGIEPFFTQFCNGTTSICDGLSQWGTVTLANEGLLPYQILRYYYGNDINIIQDAPVANVPESYPGTPMRLGSAGNDVETIQVQLNRIAKNYPSIPIIPNVNGVFGADTDAAVRRFQQIFNLAVDGIVGKATWYKIKSIYNGVKQLSELTSEGLTLSEASRQYPSELALGSTGDPVRNLQYYLAVVGYFDPRVPLIEITGTFDQATEDAVRAFQESYGLTVDGIVGRETWNRLIAIYDEIVAALPPSYFGRRATIYPGRVLTQGLRGEDVRNLQNYLNTISASYPSIPYIDADGIYGPATEQAVIAFQELFSLPPTGNVSAPTWDRIASIYDQLIGAV